MTSGEENDKASCTNTAYTYNFPDYICNTIVFKQESPVISQGIEISFEK